MKALTLGKGWRFVATWVIGDIHGCWETLQRLLDGIRWDPAEDELWLVGDLVNRGPRSLEVLRWARNNGDRIVSVLGNHDLHLLARARGLRPDRPEDRLEEVFAADDCGELLQWLQTKPFLHRRADVLMVHAGLWPGWTADEAERIARAASAGIENLLDRSRTKPKPIWEPELDGVERQAAAAAVFTLLRTVHADGRPDFRYTGPPEGAPEGCRPWFEGSRVVADGCSVIFGHWALLGLHRESNVTCLDSGCVYGGSLTALCLDNGKMVQQPLADRIDENGG